MENEYIVESTICRKCKEVHRVEKYRELKYYHCPYTNRVLLLNNETPNLDEEQRDKQ